MEINDADMERIVEQLEDTIRCVNCAGAYRRSAKLRGMIFELYRDWDGFTYDQFVYLATLLTRKEGEPVVKRLVNDSRFADIVRKSFPDQGLWKYTHPFTPVSLLLMLDAILLFGCPNAYVHLLRDALEFQLGEYNTKWERQAKLRQLIKWTLVTSRRAWTKVYAHKPERPPRDWWVRTVHKHQLRLRFSA